MSDKYPATNKVFELANVILRYETKLIVLAQIAAEWEVDAQVTGSMRLRDCAARIKEVLDG